MNRIVVIALAASTVALGAANARQLTSAPPTSHMEVIYMNGHSDMGTFNEKITPDRKTEQQAQAEIRKDPALRRELRQHNVEMKNVMAIDKAADGSTFVYVQ